MRRLLSFALAVVSCASLGALTVSAQAPATQAPVAKAPAAQVPATGAQVVRVEGADYSFIVPANIKAGLTVFNLVNVGRDVHAMTVLALPSGRTMKQFLDVFKASGKTPAWAPALGETGTIKPGDEAFVTARLKPGRYVLACFIAAADGRSHTEVGMVQLVTAR
ncbi:MAG: hypothetical protein AABZ29_08920 [Gemmatimonadota bacterium]